MYIANCVIFFLLFGIPHMHTHKGKKKKIVLGEAPDENPVI